MHPINGIELENEHLRISDCIKDYLTRGQYLSSVPSDVLSERTVHLTNNCFQFDHNSMVQLCIKEDPNMFMRLMDAFAETTIRHGSVQVDQNPEPWNRANNIMITASEEIAGKTRILKSHVSDETEKMLFRFSSYEFMRELFQEGGLFLQSASAFKNQENLAVKDDELKLTLTRYLSKTEAAEVARTLGHAAMSKAKALEYSVTSPDFLALCLTDAVNYRMISDWSAEAAVIIHDPDEFYQRLRDATTIFQTDKNGLESKKLRYIDPYFDMSNVQSADLPYCKHFKFSYQREFRFVVRNSQKFSHKERKIYLGSLSDIASLIDLR